MPVVALAGMMKVPLTVPDAGRDRLVPVIVPSMVMLRGTKVAGGKGGLVGRVMVSVTVVPRAAEPPGATAVEAPPTTGAV